MEGSAPIQSPADSQDAVPDGINSSSGAEATSDEAGRSVLRQFSPTHRELVNGDRQIYLDDGRGWTTYNQDRQQE